MLKFKEVDMKLFEKLFGNKEQKSDIIKEQKSVATKPVQTNPEKEASAPAASNDPQIVKVANLAEISYKEAEEKMNYAKDNFGISYNNYIKYEAYTTESDEELKGIQNLVADTKERARKQREELARQVAEEAGIDFDAAMKNMKKAKKDMGVSFKEYAKNKFYELDPEQQKEKYAQILAKKEQKKAAQAEKAKNGPDLPFGGKISSVTNEGIEYYWKKVEIANGYEVFRAYDEEGPFESIYVAPKRNIGTYIDGDFDHTKKKVYYTVRSYVKDENGNLIYSETIEPTEASYQESIIMEREATYLYAGVERSIYALYGWGQPEDGIWSSDDESVAVISSDGIIKGIAKGECTIRFTSESTGQSATSKVVVERDAIEPLGPITSRFHFDRETATWKNPDAKTTGEAVIMMVGDMMCSSVQMRNQYSEKEGFNFNDSFNYTKAVMKESDFAVGNLETLLAPGWPYMIDEGYINNYNNCNAPSRYLDAVKHGGFDAVMMSNNHNCDGGLQALIETIQQVDKYQFARTGAFLDKDDSRFFIADINGIKVGFLAYINRITGFNYKEETWAPEERDTHLNIFSKEKAKSDIEAVRAAGAEYVITYMHWGMKNFYNLTKEQLKDAQDVADAGTDFIVGANPHVLQKYDIITSEDGRDVPCYFSTGNYQAVMNQVEGNRDSIVIRLRLKRQADGSIKLCDNNYIPSYAYRRCGMSNWSPVAISNAYNGGALKLNKKKILSRITNVIGDKVDMI